MSAVKRIKALLDFARTAPEKLLTRATVVLAKLYGNPAYSTPPVDMDTFKSATDRLEILNAKALDGGKTVLSERNAQADLVVEMLRDLAHYVETACKGEMATFLSSGFDPAPTKRTQTPPLSDAIRKIVPGRNSGQFLVTVLYDPDAASYELRWIPSGSEATGAWTIKPVATTRPATLVENLIPGTTYVFQVRAVIGNGYSDWSEPVKRICT